MNAHAPVQIGNDPWDFWWRLGYRDIIPVVPPRAELYPKGQLAKRLAAGEDARGKAPGTRGRDGLWNGFRGWQVWQTVESDLERWRDQGASIGIRGSAKLAAVDADTRDERLAGVIKEIVERYVGKVPVRVGNYPKALYLVRTSAPFPYTMIPFGEKHEDGKRDRVEILTTGKQFVVHGEHATTGRPYHWPRPPVGFDALPEVTPEALRAMMAEIKAAMPLAGDLHEDGGALVEVDQASLEGDPDTVEAAVRAIGNTSAQFPTRESYVQQGYRIKAALARDPARGKALYLEWCESWKGGTNDPDVAEADWERMKPPFRTGAGKLLRMANEATGGAFTAQVWHEDLPPPPPAPAWSKPATVFDGVEIPPQRWLVKEMIPARTVTLLYGDGGTGKSLISLQLAFSVAATGRWLDLDTTRGPALFVTAEDESEEVHRRTAAIVQGSGLTMADLGNLHWRSLSGQDAVLAFANGKGLMEATPLFARLREEVMRLRPVLLVLDTLADLFGGDEIKRVQARQFIQMLQGLVVGLPWDMSIVLLGHPSVAGMNSGTGTSGSTAWSNSVRSRLYLERRLGERGGEKVEIDPDIRILSTKKANRTKQGGEVTVRWSNGRFIAQTSVAPSRDPDADAADEGAFLAILAEFDRSERPVSPNPSSPTYAPRLFLTHPIGGEVGKARLEGAMSRLFGQDVIFVRSYGAPTKGHKRIARRQNDLFG